MVGLAWVGQGFGPGVSSHGWASLLACSSVGIGLSTGVFWVVGACTQIWVWGLVAEWLLLVDTIHLTSSVRDFRASKIGESWCEVIGFCWPVIVLYRLAAKTRM